MSVKSITQFFDTLRHMPRLNLQILDIPATTRSPQLSINVGEVYAFMASSGRRTLRPPQQKERDYVVLAPDLNEPSLPIMAIEIAGKTTVISNGGLLKEQWEGGVLPTVEVLPERALRFLTQGEDWRQRYETIGARPGQTVTVLMVDEHQIHEFYLTDTHDHVVLTQYIERIYKFFGHNAFQAFEVKVRPVLTMPDEKQLILARQPRRIDLKIQPNSAFGYRPLN